MADGSLAIRVILAAGLVCGVLDGLSAVGISLYNRADPAKVFQWIASGLLGPSSFEGGAATTALGVALHFTVAFGAATVFFLVSRRLPILIEHALLCGMVYGLMVHLVMVFVVTPLSRIGYRPPAAMPFIRQVIIHMLIVGPSIALTMAAMLKRSSK